MNPTSISWVRGPDGAPGFTWNPMVGCTPVSAGCANCWAARLASTRLDHLPDYKGLAKDGKWIGGARFLPDRLAQPLHKRKPAGIFVRDMGDLFHEDITDEQLDSVFGIMAACQFLGRGDAVDGHRFYILTKRAKRQREYLQAKNLRERWAKRAVWYGGGINPDGIHDQVFYGKGPLSNVFVGVSIEDQPTADERIPELLQTPAAVRFVSYEPALAAVRIPGMLRMHTPEEEPNPTVDWVIVGGESGPSARPCHVEWIRSIIPQCQDAGCAVFTKQLGSNCVDRNDRGLPPTGWPDCRFTSLDARQVRINLRDRTGADPSEWPEDLRVREWPESR